MCKSQSRKIITGFSLKQGTWDYQSAELVFWRLCQCPGDFWLMLLSTHIPGWGCSRKQDCSPNTGSCCREQGFSFTPEQPTPAPNNQSPAPGRCQHWDLHHLCKFPAPEKDSWERRMLQHRPALALSTESSTGGHSAVRAQDTSLFVLANLFIF